MNELNFKEKSEEYSYTQQLIHEGKHDDALQIIDKIKEKGEYTLHDFLLYDLLKCDILSQQGLWNDLFALFDPSTFINPLFTNKAVASNFAQVDDAQVQQWMEEALTETDPVARELLYYNIQERLIEEVYPWIWVGVSRNIDVYVSNLRGWQANSMKDMFKTVYFV